MIRYKTFCPTSFDHNIPIDGKDEWLVVPCGRNRDSDCLEESNFTVALDMLGGESDDVELHRFGHWARGWFELLLVRPESEAYEIAEEIERKLENYPLLDEDDLMARQHEEANLTWKECYNNKERANYIREHRDQFEFRTLTDLMQCVRGYHFAGYASELIGE